MRSLLPILCLAGCTTVCPEPGALNGSWSVFATVLSSTSEPGDDYPSYHSPVNGPIDWTISWGEALAGPVQVLFDEQLMSADGVWSTAECGRFELSVTGSYVSVTSSEHDFVADGEFVVWDDALEGAWDWQETWTHREGMTGTFEAEGQVSGAR